MKLLIIVLLLGTFIVLSLRAVKGIQISLSNAKNPDNSVSDDFNSKFWIFRRYNYQAYQEAHNYLLAFYSLQEVAGSYQLYSNAEDMYHGCMNALQSIIISIDDREFLNDFQDNLVLFDSQLQLVLAEYRNKLQQIPITTSWGVLNDPSEPKAFKYTESDAYKWYI